MRDVENVLGDAGFWTAMALSVVGVALVWWRVRRSIFEPGVAVAALVACLVGLRVEHRLSAPLVVGAAVMLVGEWLARDFGTRERSVALVPGAVILGASLPDGWPFWMRALVAITAVVGGALATEVDRFFPRLVPLLLAIGAVGVYACVPDTEAPKALLGALVGAALLGFEPPARHATGMASLVGVFAWVATYGGLGRAGSVVGGVACLGVVLLVPLLRMRASVRTAVTLAIAQIALVAFVSRVAGFEASAWTALSLCIVAFAICTALLAVGQER